MVGELALKSLAVFLIRVVLAIAVPVTHPGLTDAASRVLAGKLDGRVAHMCDALAVLLVTKVHAVRVSITAPSHRNTQTVHSALELIRVATAGRPRGLIGTVGMSLIAVISTVVVSITRPVLWNTAAAAAFKLHTGARVTAAGFITVIPTVVIIITTPVDIDAASIGTSELSEWETGGISTRWWFI